MLDPLEGDRTINQAEVIVGVRPPGSGLRACELDRTATPKGDRDLGAGRYRVNQPPRTP